LGEQASGYTFKNLRDLKMDNENRSKTNLVGSVMVVGGGIAGMQSALDLANSGYYVYLVEKSSAVGGMMSQLDKTFPTNDCAM
jgi:heterodisulfide reductase subunit A